MPGPGNSPMENTQKAQLRAQIDQKIEDLKEDIRSYENLTRPVSPDNAIGRLTRMEALNSKSINEAALHKARQLLSRLEKARQEIDNEDFGLCRNCEEPIPFKRMLIMPEARLCVQCAAATGG